MGREGREWIMSKSVIINIEVWTRETRFIEFILISPVSPPLLPPPCKHSCLVVFCGVCSSALSCDWVSLSTLGHLQTELAHAWPHITTAPFPLSRIVCVCVDFPSSIKSLRSIKSSWAWAPSTYCNHIKKKLVIWWRSFSRTFAKVCKCNQD